MKQQFLLSLSLFILQIFSQQTIFLEKRNLEATIYKDCKTIGKVIDESGNPIPNVDISGNIYLMSNTGQNALTFYKKLDSTKSDSEGKFLFQYDIEKSEDIVTLQENLKFEYIQYDEKQIQEKQLIISQATLFGSKDCEIKMKFQGLIKGIVTDSTLTSKLQNIKITAQLKETSNKVSTISDKNGNYELKIEIPPNKKSQITLKIKPSDSTQQQVYTEQEFTVELGPDNNYQLEQQIIMLKEKQIEVMGTVMEESDGKLVKDNIVQIKIGEQSIETKSNKEGKYSKVIELNKENWEKQKKNQDINSKVFSQKQYEIGVQEFVVKKEENVYIIEDIKLTNKLNYQVKINKLQDSLKKEIQDKNVKIKVEIGEISFDLEQKKVEGVKDNDKFIYYYIGSKEIIRTDNKVNGKIIISNCENYENKEVSLTENLETLESTSFTTEIKQITLQQKKKTLEMKGKVISSKNDKTIKNAKISVKILCQDCAKQVTQTSSTTSNDKGEFSLNIKDVMILNQKQTIELTVSAENYLTKTVSKQFNGKIQNLEELKNEEWVIKLESQQMVKLEGTVKNKLSQNVLPKTKISYLVSGEQKETVSDDKGKFSIEYKLNEEKLKISIELTFRPDSDEYDIMSEKVEIKQKDNYKLVKTFELLKKNEVVFSGTISQKDKNSESLVVVDSANVEIIISNNKDKDQILKAKSNKKGEYFIGGGLFFQLIIITLELNKKLLQTFISNKVTIKASKDNYFDIKELTLKENQQEYQKNLIISKEFLYKVKINKITDTSGTEITDKNINIKVQINTYEFELKRINNSKNNNNQYSYEGEQILERQNSKLTGKIVITGLEDYNTKEIPLTFEFPEKIEQTKEISLVEIESKEKSFRLKIKGLLTEENNKPLSAASIKIDIISKDKKEQQTIINSKTVKTDSDGKYDTEINIKDNLQGDISIKLTPQDSWTTGESKEIKITLDKEKQKKNQVQEIDIEAYTIEILRNQLFSFEGVISGDITGEEKDDNMKGIQNAEVQIVLIDSLSEEKFNYNAKTDKNGNYKIEFKNKIRMGIEYKAEFTVDATTFQQQKETIKVKTVKKTDNKIKNFQLETNLVTKSIVISGEVQNDENEGEQTEIIVQIKKDSQWIDLVKGSSDKTGKFTLKAEITAENNAQIEAKYQIKSNTIETQEKQFTIDINEKNINIDIKVKQKDSEKQILLLIEGIVIGLEANENLQGANIEISLSYLNLTTKKEENFTLEGSTNSEGYFHQTKQTTALASTIFTGKLTVTASLYTATTLTFELTSANDYHITLHPVLNFNFPDPLGYETIKGKITREEKCGDEIVVNIVKELKFKVYLSGYYVKDLLYGEVESDKEGKFDVGVPVYDFEYNALLYFPYFVIEGTDDAYVQSDNSFVVKKSDSNKTLKLGSIQMANRRDHPFQCSVEEEEEQKE